MSQSEQPGGACEFCSGDPPQWAYQVRMFRTKPEIIDGRLAVAHYEICDRCHDCVQRDDWRALEDRCAQLLLESGVGGKQFHRIDLLMVRLSLRTFFLQFGENRMGPAYKLIV